MILMFLKIMSHAFVIFLLLWGLFDISSRWDSSYVTLFFSFQPINWHRILICLFTHYCEMNICDPLPNSYVEILSPSVVELGAGAFGSNETFRVGIGTLMKRDTQNSFTLLALPNVRCNEIMTIGKPRNWPSEDTGYDGRKIRSQTLLLAALWEINCYSVVTRFLICCYGAWTNRDTAITSFNLRGTCHTSPL